MTRYFLNEGKDCCDNNAACTGSESNWNNGFDTGDVCYLSGGGGGWGGLGLVKMCSDGDNGDGENDGGLDNGFDNGFDNGLGSYGDLPATLNKYRSVILNDDRGVVGCAMRCLKNGGKDSGGVFSVAFPSAEYQDSDGEWRQITTSFPNISTNMKFSSGGYESVIGFYHLFPGEVLQC